MSWLREWLLRIVRRRDQAISMAWGRWLFRLPFGINCISSTNSPDRLLLVSRHPKWSITWIWFVDWDKGGLHLHRQRAMPYRPGQNNFDRKKFGRYVHRIAKKRARVAYDNAFRDTLMQMMEPPQ